MYGAAQSLEENESALGPLDLHGVEDGDSVALPPHAYAGKRGLGVEVFAAPHKEMPAVAFGLFRSAKKLKPEFASQQHRIGELLRENPDLEVSEMVRERILFYSGDTSNGGATCSPTRTSSTSAPSAARRPASSMSMRNAVAIRTTRSSIPTLRQHPTLSSSWYTGPSATHERTSSASLTRTMVVCRATWCCGFRDSSRIGRQRLSPRSSHTHVPLFLRAAMVRLVSPSASLYTLGQGRSQSASPPGLLVPWLLWPGMHARARES